MMHLVDSSCWLEYFSGSQVGDAVASCMIDTQKLLVPTIVIYEVFKKLLIEVGEDNAIQTVAQLIAAQVIDLDATIAMHAAQLGKIWHLPLADSIIYACAQSYGALLYTQDAHFKDLPGVRYFNKHQG